MHIKNIFLISMIALLVSCSSKEAKQNEVSKVQGADNEVELTDAQIKNAGIIVGRAEKGKMSSLLKVNGIVDVPPQNRVSISFPLGGYLKSTHLLEGTHVRKGEQIAVIEDQGIVQLQQDYLVAVSKVNLMEKEYERQKSLNENKSASDKIFEQTASDFQIQKITLQSLREKLRLIGMNPDKITENNITRAVNMYSPIDGYVSAVKVNIGKFVNPSEVLFELVNPDDFHLSLRVFERDMPSVKVGQQIKAYMVNNPSKIYDAEVILVSKDLDADRTATVHCHFEHAEHDLLPGMFMNAEIEINNESAILVPVEAVVRFGDKEFVFADKGNHRFELIPVKTGNTANSRIEVSSDKVNLMEQNLIVANAYAALMKMQNKAEEE